MRSTSIKLRPSLCLRACPCCPPESATATEDGLGVIVVTAQRREEKQDVPCRSPPSGVRSSMRWRRAGRTSFLSARVPSLIIRSSFGRTFPRFYIRRLGSSDFDFNASQPVSLVYDDVVLENPILKGFPVFDLDRVEVLRGPQGTLFGRNTPAGIVKFDSVKPGDELSGYGRVSYGRFNALNAQGAVGGPIAGDTVSARLSVLYQRQSDYIDNVCRRHHQE
jgi:iron complex outermembrane receptor protein